MVWTRHAFDVSYEPLVSYKVQCRECGLATKDYPTEAAAIAAWNQRATPSPSAQLTAALGECALLTEACQEKEAELVTVRADRDEAIGAALKMEQLNFDQAQEIKALRKLREACQRYGQAMVDDRAKDGYHSGGIDIQDAEDELWQALAACDEASAAYGR